MWEQVFSVAISNGIFACLFVALLVYELKDSRSREKKYQKTIDVLSIRLSCIENVREDVEEIKDVVVLKRRKNESKIENKTV